MKRKWTRLVSILCICSMMLCMGMGTVSYADEKAEAAENAEQPDSGLAETGEETGTATGAEQVSETEGSVSGVSEGSIQPSNTRAKNISVSYAAHVQDIGWQNWVSDGKTAGTTGQKKRMEALMMNLSGGQYAGGIEYRAHVQNIGWQNWVSDGKTAGTTGQSLRIEAVQIQLTGEAAQYYDIYYRVHSANFGWLGWAKNGEIAGTVGWSCAAEALEVRLVEKGGPAPGSTANHYKPSMWQVNYQQNGESTTVAITPESLNEIARQGTATKLSVHATMSYNGQVTREITAEKNISDIVSSGFYLDFQNYGKFNVTAQFIKDGKVVASESQTVGVAASEYNLAPISATFPVVLFSLSLWDINTNAAGQTIPTMVMLQRPLAYNWDALPAGVYAMPYLTKEAIKSGHNDAAFAAYIKDLYEISPNAVFHLYINDIDCSDIMEMIYANRIPQGQYTITLMSDGSATYNIFNEAYSGADTAQKHQELVNIWNNAKQDAYRTGQPGADWGWHAHWDCMYAVLTCEPGTQWWVARSNLFTSGNEEFTAQVKNDVTVKAVNSMLNALVEKGDATVQAFKKLYNFNEGYFADAEAQGKKAMMILGTYVQNEVGFSDYAQMTQLYYGDEYLYYYKGHPNTPTGMHPEKATQLEGLGITDVDSSVAAELILFFNPEISMSGYGSSTFSSASEEMACGLYNISKANALSSSSSVDYSGIDWFATPVDKAVIDAEIGKLCAGNDTYYLLEFSDRILAEGKYSLAIYNATKASLTFYLKTADGYQAVKTRNNERKISYRAHVAMDGWLDSVNEGMSAGTVGQSKAMEALTVQLENALYSGSVRYQAHVANIGWQDWVKDGQTAGTTGKSLQMEAVRMELTGEMAKHYDIYYRVQVQDYGWLDWAKNGEIAGTTGFSKRLETVQVRLVEKGETAPGNTAVPSREAQVLYAAHVQNEGWQNAVYNSEIAGTVGESKRMEAISIKNLTGVSGNIEYRSHVQNSGWEWLWRKNGEWSGTVGKSRRLEAIQIRLTGKLAEQYDVYYRVHVQDYGWLDWAKNGEPAGTAGLSKQMEAIEIRYVEKGKAAPGSTKTAYIEQ